MLVCDVMQKARLDQIRKERELEDHEEDSMGDYVRIYPSTDWTKAKVYDTLIKSANKVSLVGEFKGLANCSCWTFFYFYC